MSTGLFVGSIWLESQVDISMVFRGRSERYFRISSRRFCEFISVSSSVSFRPLNKSVTDRTADVDITVLHLSGCLSYK
jgi:hypothetical protein